MKRFTPTLLALLLVILLSGCAWLQKPETQERLKATGLYVAERAGMAATRIVLSAAVSATDREQKIDFTQGLAQGLRTEQGNLVTADDLRSLVAIWTPQKSHWEELGNQLATIYEQQQPKTVHDAAVVLEQMAQGLEGATK